MKSLGRYHLNIGIRTWLRRRSVLDPYWNVCHFSSDTVFLLSVHEFMLNVNYLQAYYFYIIKSDILRKLRTVNVPRSVFRASQCCHFWLFWPASVSISNRPWREDTRYFDHREINCLHNCDIVYFVLCLSEKQYWMVTRCKQNDCSTWE